MYAIYGLEAGTRPPPYAESAGWYTAESWPALDAAIGRALETGEGYEVPIGIVRADGSVRNAITRGEAIRGPDGTIVGLRGAVVDVTALWRAEEALRQAMAELEEAQRVGRTGSFVISFATGTGTWSDELNRIYGRPPGSPAPPPDELDGMLPGDGHIFRDAVAYALEHGATDEAFEHPYRRPDGTTGWLLTRGVVERGPDGTPLRIRGTETDVTDLHEAREAVRASSALQRSVFDALSDGIVVQAPDGRIIAANPAARRILGLGLDELTGRTSFDPDWGAITEDGAPFPGEDHPAMVTVATGEPRRGVRMGLAHPDGRRIWISINSEALRDEQGRITGVVASFTDITANRELEIRLQRAQRLEAVGQLAGGIAHDFNNLLAAIRGYNELVRDQLPDGSPIRDDIDEALAAADRAARLTHQLLAFSRRQTLRPEVVDPAVTLAQLAPMLRRLLGEDVELEVDVAPGTGRIRVDPGQLEQVLVNLALNARDAMPDGGRLTFTLADVEGVVRDPAEGDEHTTAAWVQLIVADTGVGMEPAVLKRVFEPFFTTKPLGKGSGMGLATVLGIVEQSGGHLNVTSEPGGGTTFTILLPRVQEEGVVADAVADDGPEEAVRGAGTETVLLVEDEVQVRHVAARLLRHLGYTVLVASRPDEALALDPAALEAVDVLVTDVVMPGRSGVKLADELELRLGRTIPTVFVSGYAPESPLEERLRRTRTAFVAKPFSRDALATGVRAVLGDAGRRGEG